MPNDSKYTEAMQPFAILTGLTSHSDAEVSTYDATASGLFYTRGITKSQDNPEIIAACNKVILQSDTSMHVNESGNGPVEKFIQFLVSNVSCLQCMA